MDQGAEQLKGIARHNRLSGVVGRLSVAFVVVVLLVSVPLVTWFYHYAHDVVEDRAKHAATSILEHHQELLQESVATHDYWPLFRLTRSLAKPQYIESAAVVDRDGEMLAHSDPAVYGPYAPFPASIEADAQHIPIHDMRGVIGELVLVWNDEARTAGFAPVSRAVMISAGSLSVLAVGLGVGVALMWRNRLAGILEKVGERSLMPMETVSSDVLRLDEPRPTSDELEALEQELTRALDRLRLSQWILDSTQESIMLLDAEGRIRHHNRAMDDCVCSEECQGAHILDYIDAEDRSKLTQALGSENSGTLEVKLNSSAGASPVLLCFRHAGDITVVTMTDLTDYHALRDRIERMRVLSILGEMAADLSHEIKNDIAPIKLLCHGTGLQEEDLRVMLRSINRIDELVDDFMTFIRGETQAERTVSLASYVSECCQEFDSRAVGEGVQLEVSAPEEEVCIPAGGFRMVVSNLVRNAMQAMSEHEGDRIVRVLAEIRMDRGVDLVVEDTGPGVSGEMRSRLFEPFVTSRERGTGLGLALVYSHVTQVGGVVRYEDRPGGGARFVVSWPPERKEKGTDNGAESATPV